MRITFFGTRGSIPKPGEETLKYGGNTSCVEVVTAAGERFVLDCGSGGHGLGQTLVADGKSFKRGHLLFSHAHWDHIQGAPFFAPFFIPGAKWDIYGPRGLTHSIYQALKGQMAYHYFPLSLRDLKASLTFHDLKEGEFSIGDVKISTHYTNHTVTTLSYRIECDGGALVYSCDHEPFSQKLAGGEGKILGQDLSYLQFLKGADLVIHDAQYSIEEYPKRVGWGHSTYNYVLRICEEAGVKNVALTHHDPMRSDSDLDKIGHSVKEWLLAKNSRMRACLAREGQEIIVGGDLQLAANFEGERPLSLTVRGEKRVKAKALPLLPVIAHGHSALLCNIAEKNLPLLLAALREEGITAKIAPSTTKAIEEAKSDPATIAIVEVDRRDGEPLAAIDEIAGKLKIPTLIVAEEESPLSESAEAYAEWLLYPFTGSLLRAKAAAWILRSEKVRPQVLSSYVKIDDCREALESLQANTFNRIAGIPKKVHNLVFGKEG